MASSRRERELRSLNEQLRMENELARQYLEQALDTDAALPPRWRLEVSALIKRRPADDPGTKDCEKGRRQLGAALHRTLLIMQIMGFPRELLIEVLESAVVDVRRSLQEKTH